MCDLTKEEMKRGLIAIVNDAYTGLKLEHLDKLEQQLGSICKCHHYDNTHNSFTADSYRNTSSHACDVPTCDCGKFEAELYLVKVKLIQGSKIPNCFHCKADCLVSSSQNISEPFSEIEYFCSKCGNKTREPIPRIFTGLGESEIRF